MARRPVESQLYRELVDACFNFIEESEVLVQSEGVFSHSEQLSGKILAKREKLQIVMTAIPIKTKVLVVKLKD